MRGWKKSRSIPPIKEYLELLKARKVTKISYRKDEEKRERIWSAFLPSTVCISQSTQRVVTFAVAIKSMLLFLTYLRFMTDPMSLCRSLLSAQISGKAAVLPPPPKVTHTRIDGDDGKGDGAKLFTNFSTSS